MDTIELTRLSKAKENVVKAMLEVTKNEIKSIYSEFYGVLPDKISIPDEDEKLEKITETLVDRYFATIEKYKMVKIENDTYAKEDFKVEREEEIERVKEEELKKYRNLLTMTTYPIFSKFVGSVLKKRTIKYVDKKFKNVEKDGKIETVVTEEEKEYGKDLQFLTHVRKAFDLKAVKIGELVKHSDLIKQCYVLYTAMFDSGHLEEGVNDVFGKKEEPKSTKNLFDFIKYKPENTELYTRYYRANPNLGKDILTIKNGINQFLLDLLEKMKGDKKKHRLVFNMVQDKVGFDDDDFFMMLFGEMYFIHKVTSMFKVGEFKKTKDDVVYYEFVLSGENNMIDVRNEIANIQDELKLIKLREKMKSETLKSVKKEAKISSRIKLGFDDDDDDDYSFGVDIDTSDDEEFTI